MSTIIIAAIRGDLRAVQEAIRRGENIDTREWNGFTALICAARNGHISIVRELLSSGATVDLASKDGDTALIIAAKNGHRDTVRELLSSGAAVDRANYRGDTALISAVSSGHIDIVRDLLSSGATVDYAKHDGNTALIRAAIDGRTDIVIELLSSGATVDLANNDGYTALMYAARYGHTNIVRDLISPGITVDLANKDGDTALIWAAKNGKADIVRELLSSKATVDLANKDGYTALIYAARCGYTNIVRDLLSSGTTVDLANKDGDTALIWAAKNDSIWDDKSYIVGELLSSGATVYLTNNDGNTALMEARKHKNPSTISLLEEAEKLSQPPQRETIQESPVSVPVLPRNWTLVSDRNRPVYLNAETNNPENKVSTPPGYPLLQTSTHPDVIFYDEPQKKEFTSSGGHADFNNGVEITIPPHAIPPGSTIGIKVQPSLAPKDVFAMPQAIQSASASYLVSNEGVKLNMEVTLIMEHHLSVQTKEEADQLIFLQADSSPKSADSKCVYEYQEVPASRSEFIPGENKGILIVNLANVANKFVKVGIKQKRPGGTKPSPGNKPNGPSLPEGPPPDRNLYTVRVYRSPPQTTGDRIAIVAVSLHGRLYAKFLEDFDRVVIPHDYPEVSTNVADRTTLNSLHFEEMFAKVNILSVQGWTVDPDKEVISESEASQPETENFKPEELHDYPPRIVCRFFPEDNAPDRTKCTLFFAGLKPEIKVHIPLEAPQVKTIVDTQKLQEAADELMSTAKVVKVNDVRLGSTAEAIMSLMKRITAALQSSSLLSDLHVHTDSLKLEVQIVRTISKEIAKESTRQAMKDRIKKSLSEIKTLSDQLSQVTKVKLKNSKNQVDEATALVDLVDIGACITRAVDSLLKLILTFKDIISLSEDDTKLEREIKEGDFYNLANYFENVDTYLGQLEFTEGQKTDIRDLSFRRGTRAAMSEAIRLWHDCNPFAAKFSTLIDILVDMEKYNVAIKVCEYCVDQ